MHLITAGTQTNIVWINGGSCISFDIGMHQLYKPYNCAGITEGEGDWYS